ncbi:MAG TPA: AAA family ATPase [Acidimicrobiia bacterium]|nr:AAA family ATPase [Acidimicrobiia bacterium]
MAATLPSAFVGRDAELARLVAALHDARQGRAQAVVVEGESGAGKTRLLREFATVATDQGATVLVGRCIDCGEAGPPFWPFVEALRPLRGTGGPADRHRGDRAGYFEEVLDQLAKAAQHAPVVLLLDDLHWADGSTRDLLAFLVANLAGGPGPLVAVAVRREALVPGHPLVPLLGELRRSRRAEFITLERLSKSEVAAQLTSILGETPEPELLDDIWRRSEGNPFFVEELLESARSGQPPTAALQPILAARLSALSPPARGAARAVAASVGPVNHGLLAEVAGLPDVALLAGLRECVDQHVLVVDHRTGTYTFRHNLLREAAYAGLLPGEATRLHAGYGQALSAALSPAVSADRRGSTVADLAAVAMHLYAAGDAERGFPAALAAAEAAEAACGYAEAHLQYERALELSDRLSARVLASLEDGGRPDRVALTGRVAETAALAGDPQRAVQLLEDALGATRSDGDVTELWLSLGRARWAAGDSAGALAAYDHAMRQSADRGDVQAVRALAAAAEARMLAGRYAESRRLAGDALALARRLGLVREEAEVLGTLGVDLALLGDAAPAMAALDAAVDAAEKVGTGSRSVTSPLSPHPLARAILNRAEVLAGPLNRLVDAAEVAAEGLGRLRRLGLDRSYAGALAAVLANALFRAGRWDDAETVVDSALAERPTGAAAVELFLARARLAVGRGRFDAARADLERVEHRWTHAVAPRYQAPLLTLAAGLALWEGRTADARAAVARALDVVSGSDDVWLVAPVVWHGLRAEGDRAARARALGDRSDAADAAEAAAELVERARTLRTGAAPAVRPVVLAYEALCIAEGLRACGSAAAADSDEAADRWEEAAERWAGLGQPYPSAYARFREAEAVLSRRSRAARAARALRAAHETAVHLRAEPFRREIEALAGRARLTLTTGRDSASAGPDGSDPAPVAGSMRAGPLDALTARELDVLDLIVEGLTNREIGAALYISEKTASVHVSHILAKLGVRSRVQAATVAHQAGMAAKR